MPSHQILDQLNSETKPNQTILKNKQIHLFKKLTFFSEQNLQQTLREQPTSTLISNFLSIKKQPGISKKIVVFDLD